MNSPRVGIVHSTAMMIDAIDAQGRESRLRARPAEASNPPPVVIARVLCESVVAVAIIGSPAAS
ncbi:hypothetical protein QFZ53_003436 [Microbacterium natoriense]|uniref:Uncharacterized protein n=1 Tax=Microbacterium natoriense TaxID=284570 RepID=A0AAW8F0H3_9MICO|nr:hypothetical protein [Microbacterium natoriense]